MSDMVEFRFFLRTRYEEVAFYFLPLQDARKVTEEEHVNAAVAAIRGDPPGQGDVDCEYVLGDTPSSAIAKLLDSEIELLSDVGVRKLTRKNLLVVSRSRSQALDARSRRIPQCTPGDLTKALGSTEVASTVLDRFFKLENGIEKRKRRMKDAEQAVAVIRTVWHGILANDTPFCAPRVGKVTLVLAHTPSLVMRMDPHIKDEETREARELPWRGVVLLGLAVGNTFHNVYDIEEDRDLSSMTTILTVDRPGYMKSIYRSG